MSTLIYFTKKIDMVKILRQWGLIFDVKNISITDNNWDIDIPDWVVTQGNPVSPTIFNINVNAVVHSTFLEVCGPQESRHGLGWVAREHNIIFLYQWLPHHREKPHLGTGQAYVTILDVLVSRNVHKPREDQVNNLHPHIHMGADRPGSIQSAGDGWEW